MQRSDFDYDLPEALIAQVPLPDRAASRLMVLDPDANTVRHAMFSEIVSLLTPDDLLVVNDTRVIPARLFGAKDSGGRVEILIERVLDTRSALAHVRASKPLRAGGYVTLDGESALGVLRVRAGARHDDLFELHFAQPVLDVLAAVGHVPLPPYIERRDDHDDRERYQTVFAAKDGAVAAPTAGLHFDADTLARLEAKGVARVAVTLHVGAGTFQPMRTSDLDAHVMHAERYDIDAQVVDAIAATRARGGRVVAVGTTVVRALESAAALRSTLDSGADERAATTRLPVVQGGETRLFIRPGFQFRIVDALLTNFHLPGSTLIALVAAFAGHPFVLDAYREAVRLRYRFFSYGDAMFLTARAPA